MPTDAPTPKQSCPDTVLELVERFALHRDAYQQPTYNETQVRREFIDPLFKALGWDIDNEQGHAEPYKDVIHEDAIKVGGSTKAPDYCFRVGGVRKFFVEAKKPAEDINQKPEHAYQLRRYAWTAKLPLSILTDFEELAVYDCTKRPNPTDKASAGRVLYVTSDEYAHRWGEIASIFSKEAILKGAFDKFAESARRKRGTTEVDDEFLKEIESWRDELARNVALRNPNLSTRELNYAVTKTIDRIIFLRMCEDRGVETYAQLRILPNGPNIYPRLVELFRRADERYNSGLFHFAPEKGRTEAPDTLTPSLTVDDKVLKDIIKRLYYPDCPYEFSVMPSEILGQVYEQFLGKVITLTAGHRARIEFKPEVRKAGGVYYTPKYIVDYIVEHTVGKLLEGKTPADLGPLLDQRQSRPPAHARRRLTDQSPERERRVSALSILDPACGSGSFLLGAYQYLLHWHQRWYAENDPEDWSRKKSPPIFQSPKPDPTHNGPTWRLTVAERRRILVNNIYGVDIDPQAVEVTKLSLLLKVLEGESQQSLDNQLRLFHVRALPDLGANIKCGNSLIGPDFYHNHQLDLFDEEERYRINAFDWHAEFPQVFLRGDPNDADPAAGFDAVIGNPPYVLLQDEFRDDAQLRYFRSHFTCATFKIDTYHLFMERALELTKRGRWASMITPANFLTNNHLVALRGLLLKQTDIDHILVIDGGVFRGISVDNAVWLVRRGTPSVPSVSIIHARPDAMGLSEIVRQKLVVKSILNDAHLLFTGGGSTGGSGLWERCVEQSAPLARLAYVNFGKQLRDRRTYTKDVVKVKSASRLPRKYRPCYTGRDVQRYALRWGHLACLNDRVAQTGGCWDDDKQDAKRKLITRQIGRFPVFALDELGYQCLNTVFMVNVKDALVHHFYLLGILNSKLMAALWLERFYDRRRTFPKIKGTYLKHLPIRTIDPNGRRHQHMVDLVQTMIKLQQGHTAARVPTDKTAIQRQIDATDRQIDQLVYELYGLTDDDIRIVEEATK